MNKRSPYVATLQYFIGNIMLDLDRLLLNPCVVFRSVGPVFIVYQKKSIQLFIIWNSDFFLLNYFLHKKHIHVILQVLGSLCICVLCLSTPAFPTHSCSTVTFPCITFIAPTSIHISSGTQRTRIPCVDVQGRNFQGGIYITPPPQ